MYHQPTVAALQDAAATLDNEQHALRLLDIPDGDADWIVAHVAETLDLLARELFDQATVISRPEPSPLALVRGTA